MKERWISDKRGSEMLYPVIIFIVLNLIFASAIMVFVSKSASGALIYEQAYAKEIALLLDQAKPGMKISVDFSKGNEIAKKNEHSGDKVTINEENNKVVVKLSDSGGYEMNYFSKNKLSYGFKENEFIINVGEEDE